MAAPFCSRLQWQPCCRLYFVPHFFCMCTCSHSQPSVLNQLSPYTFVKLGTRNGSTPSLNMYTNITNLCHVFYHIGQTNLDIQQTIYQWCNVVIQAHTYILICSAEFTPFLIIITILVLNYVFLGVQARLTVGLLKETSCQSRGWLCSCMGTIIMWVIKQRRWFTFMLTV